MTRHGKARHAPALVEQSVIQSERNAMKNAMKIVLHVKSKTVLVFLRLIFRRFW